MDAVNHVHCSFQTTNGMLRVGDVYNACWEEVLNGGSDWIYLYM